MTAPTPGLHWRRDDLLSRLAATLDHAQLATEHLLLQPHRPSDTPDPSTAADDFLRRAKFVCETSLLLHLAAAVPRRPRWLTDRIDDIAAVLVPHARNDETSMWMRLRPAMAAELGVAHLCLASLGHPDRRFHDEYSTALTATSIGPAERMAWKDLEAGWHRELGAPLPELDLAAATRRTAYNQGQDVMSASREAAYAVTHGLIYASGFGARRPVLTRPQCRLLADTDAMLARCLDTDDFDLAAEVLFTRPFLRTAWSPATVFGLQVLDTVTADYGILPSMTLQGNDCEALPPEQRAAYYYQESYHTVYVWGLLMASILRAGQSVPRRPSVGPHGPRSTDLAAAADQLLEILPGRDPAPQWLNTLAVLGPTERGALVGLIADVGIRRAVLAKDFARAFRITLIFLATEVRPSSMVIQAGELLTRLARTTCSAAA